jgi:hypothetical protein
MLSLAFRTVVPANLDEISVERLISFRDTHSSERQAFQDEMSRLVLNLVTELPNVADPAVFAEHLAVEYEKAVTPKLKDLRKAMKSSAFETIDSIANVQCVVPPVISTAAIAAGITLAAPLALGAGALFGALGIWNIVRARQATRAQALADSDVRYLYSIERDLGPAALAQSMTTPVRRFEPLQVGPPPRR